MIIISFTGKLQNGKTTSAKIMEEYFRSLGFKVGRFSFAKALKDEVWENFLKGYDVERSDLDTPGIKEDYRTLLTWFGTDFIRKLDPNHWVKNVKFKLKKLEEEGYDIVIGDDTRFRNEDSMLKDLGAYRIRVIRDLATNNSTHASEIDLDSVDMDMTILNNDTLGMLEIIVKGISNNIIQKK